MRMWPLHLSYETLDNPDVPPLGSGCVTCLQLPKVLSQNEVPWTSSAPLFPLLSPSLVGLSL